MGVRIDYTEELADKICEQVAMGLSFRRIAEIEGLPKKTLIFEWLASKPDFAEKYARAKDIAVELMVEDALEIVDDASDDLIEEVTESGTVTRANTAATQRARLRYDARRWLAGQLKPKKYGTQRLEQQVSGSLDLLLGELSARTLEPKSND